MVAPEEDTGIKCSVCGEPSEWSLSFPSKTLRIRCKKCGTDQSVVADAVSALHLFCANQVWKIGEVVNDG